MTENSMAKILIVDDEPVNIDIISEMLSDLGYQFVSSQTGEDAIENARVTQPDLVLLDVQIRGEIDGFETCRQLKSFPETKDIPIIFVTGSVNLLKTGFEVGGVDYIGKPFTENELKARVQTHLKLRQALKDLQKMNEVLEDKVSERTEELQVKNEGLEREIEERRIIEERLHFNATHDPLTKLLNRFAFEEKLVSRLVNTSAYERDDCLIYIDIDRFHTINEACGQEGGNFLLNNVAENIKKAVRESKTDETDNIARTGNDEFAVFLTNCPTLTASKIAENIRAAVKENHFSWFEHTYAVTISVSVLQVSEKTIAVNNVLGTAEELCQRVVANGGDGVFVLEPGIEVVEKVKSEVEIVSSLRNALKENKFILFGQKIQPLQQTANIDFYEILLRMEGKDEKLLTPAYFLPAAERYNLMFEIDKWVIKNAFAWINQKTANGEKIMLAINLSGQSLNNEELANYILDEYSRCDFAPNSVCFEVTESIVIFNLEKMRDLIRRLSEKGFLFSLDDFGAGFASYAYLKELPVQYLKIDGLFIKDMLSSKNNEAVVRSMHEVGKACGKQTIAEFVENDRIAAELEKMGVDYAQGFYVHRPENLVNLN